MAGNANSGRRPAPTTPQSHRGDALIDLECMADGLDAEHADMETNGKLVHLLVQVAARIERRNAAMLARNATIRVQRDSAERSLRLADATQARIDAERAAMRAAKAAYTGPERRRSVLAEAA